MVLENTLKHTIISKNQFTPKIKRDAVASLFIKNELDLFIVVAIPGQLYE
jgi:hypothetical protein